ncbi:AglZ/HisF2 family acetamidino modification protein [Bradyrhizobium sp. OAE829]|uniref:AglZ/HisF2 family acetamidino modification protein n=1 Tax=Bradyrhizobium sp. OAE829 TaxID=2663807 RepID=UPI00178AB2B2
MKEIPRIIPCLLIEHGRLVKTTKFTDPKYVGDPLNAVRIFNEKEVDELIFLDICASRERSEIDYDLISSIASECFMPFAYGGGLHNLDQVRRVLRNGAEKVILSTAALENPGLISSVADEFGSQSVVVSVNIKRKLFGAYCVFDPRNKKNLSLDPLHFVKQCVEYGAGELFLNDVDRDGTRAGYDDALIRSVSQHVDVPVVACGGASSVEDLKRAIDVGASAVAAGSLFVLHGKHRAVLITYPEREKLERMF